MSTIEQQIAYWQGKIENWANILKTAQIPSDHGKSESAICDDEQFRYQNAIIEIHRETKALISFFQALSEVFFVYVLFMKYIAYTKIIQTILLDSLEKCMLFTIVS